MQRYSKAPLLPLLLTAVAAHGAPAIDKQFSIGVLNEWTDNAALAADNPESDMITSLHARIKLAGSTPFSDYGVSYMGRRETYQDGSFGNSTMLNGSAYMNFDIVPNRVFWRNSMSSNTTQRESGQPNVPDNRDQRHTLTTEPGVVIPVTDRDNVTVSLKGSRTDFREEGASNSDRYGGGVDWSHDLTPVLQGNVGCDHEVVEFTEKTGDYNATQCQLGGTRKIKGGVVSFYVGTKTIDAESGEEQDGTIFNVESQWQHQSHRLILIANHDLTDSSVAFTRINFVDSIADPLDVDSDNTKLVERTRLVIGLSEQFSNSLTLSGFLFSDEEDALESTDDLERDGFVVSLSKKLNWNYGFNTEYLFHETTFENGNSGNRVTEELLQARVALYKDLSKDFRITGGLLYEHQDADIPTAEFESSTLFMDLRYQF